jgi:DNA-3-methyladenine glycosylase
MLPDLSRPSAEVAPELLGCVLEAGGVRARLTEVEAYGGHGTDPGSHAHRGLTPRSAIMFGPAGRLYVYFTYGMHWCANVVTGPDGEASAVLLRAGEVIEGRELARARRPGSSDRDLCRGPARLARALGLDADVLGVDLLSPASPVRLLPADAPAGSPARLPPAVAARTVLSGPRVGLRQGAETPWRFWLDGEPTVSSYRPAVRKVRR